MRPIVVPLVDHDLEQPGADQNTNESQDTEIVGLAQRQPDGLPSREKPDQHAGEAHSVGKSIPVKRDRSDRQEHRINVVHEPC